MAHPRTTRKLHGVLLIAIAAVFALIAAACGDDGDDAAETPPETTAAPETAAAPETTAAPEPAADAPKMAIIYSAEWNDGSWGEAAVDGGNKLLADGIISDIALVENVPPGAEAERALRDFAEQGYNPIVAHSFNYGDNVKTVGAEFPDTIFAYAGGFGDVAGNVGDYDQPFYEASFLSGILGAGATEGGNVGGAGGFEIPVCVGMYHAYLAGAREIRPETDGSFVSVGDWIDVQLAKEAALGQADAGATMFVGCGQGPTFGQIEAANDIGGVSTGYVGDMAALGESVLSSFVWRLDRVFEQMVADVVAGQTEARYYSVPLADGGMDVLISPGGEGRISQEALDLFDQRLAEIQDGSFVVPFVGEN